MNKYVMWFINLKISNRNKINLIEKYNNEENIYNNIDNIINEGIIDKKYISIISSKIDYSICENISKFEKEQINCVTYSSVKYPKMLKVIENPPYVLYYKGDLSLLDHNMVAIVGTRKNSIYGEQVTKLLVNELAKISFGVVSGVASGIDSIAHREILKKDGKTIGVLGCGIDIVYPSHNKRLYEEIASNGLLITEFAPGTKPYKYNFPQRNRIISGLSIGIIVVEAALKSGSLITVNYALSQGKSIMAVPGPIFNEGSKGCNKLIFDGAAPFLQKEDLYDFLNITKKEAESIGKNRLKNVLLAVLSTEPIHLDKIIRSVNIDRIALFELLFEMQNENEIICLPGNYYVKIS